VILQAAERSDAKNERSTAEHRSVRPVRWGVVLAGGDGVRLRSLTRVITGDDRPKQFCKLLGEETLLDQTLKRVGLGISPSRTLVVVTKNHERFYAPALAKIPERSVVAQPKNRGTAPAILYALLRMSSMAPNDPVAFFPSDHYVSDAAAFMAQVEAAFEAVAERPELIVLFGVSPHSDDPDYGWIEPGDPVVGGGAAPLFRVYRFWEKPAAPLAMKLRAQGCLWNSFVMVGCASTFLSLVGRAVPQLHDALAPLRRPLAPPEESDTARAIYDQISPLDFSREVLAVCPEQLAVLPVAGVKWTDLGVAERVLSAHREFEHPGRVLVA